MVFDDSRDMIATAHDAIDFFAHESCGKCFPCRIGTQILHQALDRYRAGDAEALSYVHEVAWGMTEASMGASNTSCVRASETRAAAVT